MQLTPERYDFSKVIGISQNQLEQHYQLYLGYISSLAQIMDRLEISIETNYEYRGLKDGETYSLNGIILHELYFANLGQSRVSPTEKLLEMIRRDFGSYSDWFNDFFKVGSISRGWAVLAYNLRDERLHNIMQNTHNQGLVWYGKPLLVLDIYEHAYMIDFGINRKKYLEIFEKNINWKIVNERFNQLFPYKY